MALVRPEGRAATERSEERAALVRPEGRTATERSEERAAERLVGRSAGRRMEGTEETDG